MYRLAIAEAVRSPDVAETLNASRFVNRNALAELLVRAQQAGLLGRGEPPQMMEHFFALLWGWADYEPKNWSRDADKREYSARRSSVSYGWFG